MGPERRDRADQGQTDANPAGEEPRIEPKPKVKSFGVSTVSGDCHRMTGVGLPPVGRQLIKRLLPSDVGAVQTVPA